jgi:hypothetical protein
MKRAVAALASGWAACALAAAAADVPGPCGCGVAPERENDFYWENDLVGFRAYGPGNFHLWSGFDLFNKLPDAGTTAGAILRRPHRCGNWHATPHKGVLDNYTIGAGRGIGGVALFGDGEWKTYPNWRACSVETNEPGVCVFTLVYPACSALGEMTCRITLRAGERFFRNEVSFARPARPDGFFAGPGLDVAPSRGHAGDLVEDADEGIVSLFENARGDVEGSTMTAIVLDPSCADGATLMTDAQGCRVLAVRRFPFVYWAGAAWSRAGAFETAEAWHAEVRRFRRSLAGRGVLLDPGDAIMLP